MLYLLALTGINKRGSILHPLDRNQRGNCTIRTEIGYQGNIDRYIVPAGGGSGSAVYYQSWQ